MASSQSSEPVAGIEQVCGEVDGDRSQQAGDQWRGVAHPEDGHAEQEIAQRAAADPRHDAEPHEADDVHLLA